MLLRVVILFEPETLVGYERVPIHFTKLVILFVKKSLGIDFFCNFAEFFVRMYELHR